MKAVFPVASGDPAVHDRVVGNVENLLDDDTVALDAVELVANSGGLGLLLADSLQCEPSNGSGTRYASIKP